MPTVPTYEPQVREQALQGGFQQEIDVTKNTRALAQGLGVAGQMMDRVVIRDAEAASSKADTEIAAGWLKWDAENRKNYQGEKADGYAAAAEKWWKETSSTYGAQLDPMAKGLVSASLNKRQAASLGQVAQFVEIEKEKHADTMHDANVKTTIQFGVTSGDVASAADRVRTLSAQVGARKGWSTEQVQADTLANLSQLHIAQISKLIEQPGGATVAQMYYEKNKTEVGFAQQPTLEKIIKGETDNQFATMKAAEVAPLPLAEQLAVAATITDPARREKTLMQIKSNHVLANEAKREVEQKFSDQAWQLVGAGKKVPEAVLLGMDGKERVQLQEHLRTKAERGNAPVKTNPAALAKIYDMVRDEPEKFKKLSLVSLSNTISGSDLEQVARLQRDVNKPDREKDVATTTQLIGTYTGGWRAEKKAAFSGRFLDELNVFEKEKGRPANFEEKQKIGDRLIVPGEVSSGSIFRFDANKQYFQLTPAERAAFIPEITSEERTQIKQAFKDEGRPIPTDAQIIERYKTAKGLK